MEDRDERQERGGRGIERKGGEGRGKEGRERKRSGGSLCIF